MKQYSNDSDTVDDLLDRYWDEIRAGEQLITTLQAKYKAALSKMVTDIIGEDEYPFVKPKITITRIGKNGKGYEAESTMSELADLEAVRRNELREKQRRRAIAKGFDAKETRSMTNPTEVIKGEFYE